MSTEQISTSYSTLAFRNFVNTCRSPATRSVYVKALHYFMDYLKIDRHQYQKLLEKDPKLIQMDICDFILYLKKDRSSAAISVYVGAINKFYAMNDVNLNWKKIRSFMGEHEKVSLSVCLNPSTVKSHFL